MNVQITVREGVLQGHFTPQGPTNPRLDPYLLLGHCKLTIPRRGRQINARAAYLRLVASRTGPLQAHFTP